MKKFVATILALAYLTASSGAIVNMHYCMGRFLGGDISQRQVSKCHSCGMLKKNQRGCCRDEHKVLQIDRDQKTTDAFTGGNHLSTHPLVLCYGSYAPLLHPGTPAPAVYSLSPPGKGSIPVYVLNRQFRI